MSRPGSRRISRAGLLLGLLVIRLPMPVTAQSSLTVDTQNRADVASFYNRVYTASQGVDPGWAGDVGNCVAGDTSQAYKEATILRVNYYRAMSGLPGDITLDTNLNWECQQAASMMSAQNVLSHYPTPDWWCFSAEGADAALHANLALGSAGPEAIDAYVDDPGAGNTYVGHRRWVLFPPQYQMGTGSIPDIVGQDGSLLYPAANALWVVSTPTNRPTNPWFVAWPPAGYVPYPVLPLKSGLWSLSIPGANFSRVQLAMKCCGTNLPLTLEPLHSGDGDSTVVWRPTLATGEQVGLTYSVAVSNILVAGQTKNVNYAVTIIDPEQVQLMVTRCPPDSLLLTWQATAQSFILEEASALAKGAIWDQVAIAPQVTNGAWSSRIPIGNPERYYRLRLSTQRTK